MFGSEPDGPGGEVLPGPSYRSTAMPSSAWVVLEVWVGYFRVPGDLSRSLARQSRYPNPGGDADRGGRRLESCGSAQMGARVSGVYRRGAFRPSGSVRGWPVVECTSPGLAAEPLSPLWPA